MLLLQGAMSSSANVIDIDDDEDGGEGPFMLIVQPHPESQPGSLESVAVASFNLCHSLGKAHRVKKRSKAVIQLVCSSNDGKAPGAAQCPYQVNAVAVGPDRVRATRVIAAHSCRWGGFFILCFFLGGAL